MLERITRLEQLAQTSGERLNAIERDVAVIKSNYATKADVADAKTSIIVWVVGAILVSQLLPAVPALLKGFGLMK
jgi:hypothetical protein